MRVGRRVGVREAIAVGVLAGGAIAGCSDGSAVDFLKPAVACADVQIKLDSSDTMARTRAIAQGILTCYSKLPTGLFKSTGEANSINISFPVAGGEVDFHVLSDAPVGSDPAAYIDKARDVSVGTYQVASAKNKSEIDAADINTYQDGPLYGWATSKGEGGHSQDVKSGVQDDTGDPYLTARIGEGYDYSFDPKVMACAEEKITHAIADTFNQVTSQPDMASLPSLPAPDYRHCGDQV